ncbi:MAG: imidazolonepropionase [Dehalococcoidia bacterium]
MSDTSGAGLPATPDLVILNIGKLASAPAAPSRGPEMRSLILRSDAGIAVVGDKIAAVESSAVIEAVAGGTTMIIDAGGRAVIPGFVDPHTHAVFAGERRDEFARRLEGQEYLEILKAGGAIISTVEKTRAASSEELSAGFSRRLSRMLAAGTTTVEVKSGYGLNLLDEMKMLDAASVDWPGQTVKTFLGAHALPPEFRERRDEYVRLVCDEMLPAAVEHGATFCDVFCEKGAFSVAEARLILVRAKQLGLGLKVHADQVNPLGGAELAVELGARSADHLGAVSPAGVRALAGSRVAAVLLPASTLYVSGASRAPARALIDEGAIVAIGSDCNPGSSPVDSMPLVVSLACLVYGLTVDEALVAATANAAYACGVEDRAGRLAPAYRADILILDSDDYRDLAYRLGARLIKTVIAGGQVVAEPESDGPL